MFIINAFNRDRDENGVLDQEESDHGSGSESEEHSGKEVKEGRRRVSSSKILKCQCTTVEKQAREIQDLKRKLLQKQVYDEKGVMRLSCLPSNKFFLIFFVFLKDLLNQHLMQTSRTTFGLEWLVWRLKWIQLSKP